MDTIEKRNIRTLVKLKDLWESNIVANKPYIKHDVGELWNDSQMINGCLIAASPSLKDNIPEIKGRHIVDIDGISSSMSSPLEICVVDMAAKYLIDNGIKPDYVICCESKPEASKMLDFDCDSPLICDVMTNPEIVKRWKGEKYFFISNNPCIDLDNHNQTFSERHKRLSGISTMLTLGGNVGSAGLAFLLSVRNCRRLYLYGHEFCWEKDGDFYCGGVQKEMAMKRIKTEQQAGTLYEKKDINGKEVYTNLSLVTFLNWYKDIMNQYPDVIINRTGAGLLH